MLPEREKVPTPVFVRDPTPETLPETVRSVPEALEAVTLLLKTIAEVIA